MNRRCIELFDRARNTPKGLRFSELQKLCRCAGMSLDRTKASHFIYKSNNPSYMLSIQKLSDGKAKPYQVRQLIDFIENQNLDVEEQDNA